MSRLLNFAMSALAAAVGVLLILLVVSFTTGGVDHSDITDRQQVIEDQLRYVSCLLLIEPVQRTPDAVAGCQIPSE